MGVAARAQQAEDEPYIPPPVEPPAPRFGDAGEYVVTGAAVIGVSSVQYAQSDAARLNVVFSPGLDLFVVRGVSFGVDVDLRYERSKAYDSGGVLGTTKTTRLAGGVRVGVNVPFGRLLSLYPRATMGFASTRVAGPTGTALADHAATTTPSITLFAPLLLHAAPPLFFGAGPILTHDVGSGAGSSDEATTIAGRIVVGGWWGGRAPSRAASEEHVDPTVAEVMAPHFVGRGQWVFTNEAGATAAYSHFPGQTTAEWATAVSLAPGFDVFVARHVSGGAAGRVCYSSRGSAREIEGGGGPRFGVDIPLGPSLSLYPRLLVTYARGTVESTTLRGAYSTRTTSSGAVFAASLYAPLLFHVATHAFVGFGPSLTQEISRSVDGGSGNPVGTRIGAALVVGGWL
ncbi:hypothetical protein BH11MYX4_BH11MYX4_42870 [soil metagenome]